MKTTANKITVARMICVPLFLVLAYLDKPILCFVVYVLSCISDFADGYIARKYNQISSFGKFMDPLADKMLVISAMCFFVDCHRMPGWALAVVCLREFAVAGLRMLSAENKKVISAEKSGKIKTIVSMVGLGAMLLISSNILDIVVTVLILATTVLSGVEYFIKNKSIFKEDIE